MSKAKATKAALGGYVVENLRRSAHAASMRALVRMKTRYGLKKGQDRNLA